MAKNTKNTKEVEDNTSEPKTPDGLPKGEAPKAESKEVEDNDNIIITSKDPDFISFAKKTKGYQLK